QRNKDPMPPMLASTYSEQSGRKTAYVFGYSRSDDWSNQTIEFSPSELNIPTDAYVFNYFTHAGQYIPAGTKFGDSVGPDGSYYIVAPVGRSGIALFGDTGKFVSAGLQRVTQIKDNGIVAATLQFGSDQEASIVQGYSPTAPVISAVTGSADLTDYNSDSHIFTITVRPSSGDSHLASFSISTR